MVPSSRFFENSADYGSLLIIYHKIHVKFRTTFLEGGFIDAGTVYCDYPRDSDHVYTALEKQTSLK